MAKEIRDCKILITGGSQGLGKAFKEALEALGAEVYITSRKVQEKSFLWDMSDEGSTKKLLKTVEEEKVSFDILIHCAHIFSEKKLIPQVKPSELKTSLVANIVPIYELSRGLARSMGRQGFGRILFVGSLISEYGGAGKVSYITEKAALTGLVRSFHAEFKERNVYTNIIHPNLFETTDIYERVPQEIISEMKRQSPTGEILQVEDIIKVSLPLVLPESKTSGESIIIDGGVKW